MGNKNYTIKDIARMAGVSAGTVDRVLHNRGDVSAASLEKVRKVLDEISYQPNMFAIGLAAKKRYSIVCIIPYYIAYDYWYAVAGGIDRAAQELAPYNVTVSYLHYLHADEASYSQACTQVLGEECDAVLLAPNFREETLKLTSALEQKGTPYAFIDFNIEQTHALCYIGQDSRMSGYIAAKILMQHFKQGQELALFLNNQKQSPAEIQMQRRLEGFMQYLTENMWGLPSTTCCSTRKMPTPTDVRSTDSSTSAHRLCWAWCSIRASIRWPTTCTLQAGAWKGSWATTC